MPLFAETGLTTVLFLAALGLTIGFLLMRSNRYFSRRSDAQTTSFRVDAPAPKHKGHHLEAPAPMVEWEVQMHETARELSGQLDTKLGLLQQLIREADRAAARLEAALAARAQAERSRTDADSLSAGAPERLLPNSPLPPAGEGPGVRAGGSERASEPQGRDRFERLGEGAYQAGAYQAGASQADALKSASLGEPRTPAGGSGRAQPSESPSEKQPRDRRFQEIYTLADYGLNAAEIAQRLGTPVGEVELILGLRGKKAD